MEKVVSSIALTISLFNIYFVLISIFLHNPFRSSPTLGGELLSDEARLTETSDLHSSHDSASIENYLTFCQRQANEMESEKEKDISS